MLRSYFNQNDPYKVIGLLLLLIVSRVVLGVLVWEDVFGSGIWMESMKEANDSSLQWFKGVSGPLYQLLWFAFSQFLMSPSVNIILAAFAMLYLAVQFNTLLIRWNAFENNSYLPAALLLVVNIAIPESYLLSAPLLGGLFLIGALQLLFRHLRQTGRDENILTTGVLIGIAGMFYLPYLWFLPVLIIIYVLYSSTTGRRFLLMFWGLCMPWVGLGLYFAYQQDLTVFWDGIYVALFSFKYDQSQMITFMIALGLPFLLGLYSAFQNLSGLGMNNFQITIRSVVSWMAFFALILTLWFSGAVVSSVIMLSLPLSYYLNQLIQNMRKKIYADFLFYLLIVASFSILIFGNELTW